MIPKSRRWRLVAGIAIVLLLAPFWSPLLGLAPQPLPPAGRFVTVDGYRINVIDEGHGVPVVLVHGLPGSAYDWSPLPERLQAAGFRVIRYDRVGYGYSDRRTDDAQHTLATNARELRALLTTLHLDAPILVAWSYGGGVAVTAAADNPDAIGGLVLVASIGPSASPGWQPAFVEWPRRWAVASGVPARIATALLIRYMFRGTPPAGFTEHALSVIGAPGVIHTWTTEERYMDGGGMHPERVTTPAIVVHGDADVNVPVAVGDDLHPRLRSSTMVRVPGGTHMLPNTHADVLVEQVMKLALRRSRTPAFGSSN
jgi:pimeloyl-ACP methyl ester carboxylesterase